tara:strand:+ start:107 stop:838 length:732 start_codon:yes stop_codon:yes gene_type:complete
MAFKRRKIKRKRGKGKSNMYFTMDTQAAIVKYQAAEEQDEKETLYNKEIKYAFEKLVENLIFVYGFQSPYEPTKHLQADCVSFLLEAIHKWKVEKGTKAFSYFNVVAKNWLIGNAKKRQKRLRRSISFESTEDMSAKDRKAIAYHQVAPAADQRLEDIESKKEIIRALKAIKARVHQENEILCIDAIITIFEKVHTLDFLNKRAVFVYVREFSGLDQKQLASALGTVRKHYKSIRGSDEFNMF